MKYLIAAWICTSPVCACAQIRLLPSKDTLPLKHTGFQPLPYPRQENLKPPIPPDYYTRNFGFFCRQELRMQKANVPLSFRLGSLDYCNWLEQK